MTFEKAFRSISEEKDIERVPNSQYLYQIEGEGVFTDEQVIEYAKEMQKADELIRIRQDKKLTQLELSHKSKVSIQTIRNFEQGEASIKSASYKTLKQLAVVLECDVEDIVGKV